jgi:hypothetical protein
MMRPFLLRAVLIAGGITLAGTVASGADEAPVRFWGQILGNAPAALTARVMSSGEASPLTTCAAVVTPDPAGRFYAVEWPREKFLKAVHSARQPQLIFAPAPAAGLPLGGKEEIPDRIDLVDGVPTLPTSRFISARVEKLEGTNKTRLTAIIAHDGPAASGKVDWTPMGQTAPVVSTPLDLPARSVTVSRSTADIETAAELSTTWKVTWTPADTRLPLLIKRTVVRDPVNVSVDRLGDGGALPPADSLQLADGRASLGDLGGDPASTPGKYLELEFETSLSDEPSVRRALSTWQLQIGPNEPRMSPDTGTPLKRLAIHPLPSGGAWVQGSWMLTRTAPHAAAALEGGPKAELDGQWRVRSLSTYWVHEGEEKF